MIANICLWSSDFELQLSLLYWPFHCQSTWWSFVRCLLNFWVCGPNPMMWPFKWKLSSCTSTWCYLFFKILENEIWKFGRNLPSATFGSERVKHSSISETSLFSTIQFYWFDLNWNFLDTLVTVNADLAKATTQHLFLGSAAVCKSRTVNKKGLSWPLKGGEWNTVRYFFRVYRAPLIMVTIHSWS